MCIFYSFFTLLSKNIMHIRPSICRREGRQKRIKNGAPILSGRQKDRYTAEAPPYIGLTIGSALFRYC